MSARRVLWLLVSAVALIAAAVWLSSQRHLERAVTAGDLVLPGLESGVNTVAAVNLRKGDGAHTLLKKDGDTWRVDERGWPADTGRIRKLLLDLGALTIVEEKTRLAANYPALGVEDVSSPAATGTLIELTAPAHAWSLIVGRSATGKSGYVRIAGAPQSLLAAPLLSVDAGPQSWLERSLCDIRAERVRQVDEAPAQGPAWSATRAKKADADFTVAPLPKGRQLTMAGAANPTAAALSALTLDDVRKGEAPPDAKVDRAVYRTFDGLEIALSGRKDGAHSYLSVIARSTAKESADEAGRLTTRFGGWEFEIPEYKYATIFTPLEQLLQKPPEPVKKPPGPAKAGAKPIPSATDVISK